MSQAPDFEELIRRVRAWDQQAAAEVVRRYEPAVRRAVRLAGARLGNLLDSMDICRSMMASFFIRATSGQYEPETPARLRRLLTTMGRNKRNARAREQHARRRDSRRVEADDQGEGPFVSAGAGPGTEVAARDLLQEVHRRSLPDERRRLEMKNQGHDRSAIAAELGGGAEARRRRLSRSLDRIAAQLGPDDAP
jgi:DNA-directed RNA polymerase specialized sigma24 family protein